MHVMQVMQAMQVMQVKQVIQVIGCIQRWWPFLVARSGGQICTSCKYCHLEAKFATNVNGAICYPYVQAMQVVPSGGQIRYWCKWCNFVTKFNPSCGVNFWVRCASGNVYLKMLAHLKTVVNKTDKFSISLSWIVPLGKGRGAKKIETYLKLKIWYHIFLPSRAGIRKKKLVWEKLEIWNK